MKSGDHPFRRRSTCEHSRRASCEDPARCPLTSGRSSYPAPPPPRRPADERRRPPRFTARRGLDACAAGRLVNRLERRVRSAYYCNAQLGKTQWEPPTALPPPPPTASTAPTRCWPDVDTCVTNGDSRGGALDLPADNRRAARARGASPPSCTSLHRLPSQAEEDRLAHSADGLEHDVFGRKRGALPAAISASVDPLRCQTILVRGLPAALNARECRSALEEFEEWGKLVRTWTLAEPGAGYVKFRHRGNAQFCLEAMHGRPLRPDSDEVLELSWAAADPALAVAQQGHALALRQMAEAKARRDEQHRMYDALEREGLEHAAKKPRAAWAMAPSTTTSRGGSAPMAAARRRRPTSPSGRRAEATRPQLPAAPSLPRTRAPIPARLTATTPRRRSRRRRRPRRRSRRFPTVGDPSWTRRRASTFTCTTRAAPPSGSGRSTSRRTIFTPRFVLRNTYDCSPAAQTSPATEVGGVHTPPSVGVAATPRRSQRGDLTSVT